MPGPGERFDLWFGILVAQLMVTLCFLAVMGAVFAWRQTPERAWPLQGAPGLVVLATVGPRSPAPLLLLAALQPSWTHGHPPGEPHRRHRPMTHDWSSSGSDCHLGIHLDRQSTHVSRSDPSSSIQFDAKAPGGPSRGGLTVDTA